MKITATLTKLPKRALSVLMSMLMVVTAIPLLAPAATAAAPPPGAIYPRPLPLSVLERFETAMGAGASGIIANDRAGDILPGHTYIDADNAAMQAFIDRLDRLLGHTGKGNTNVADIMPFLELILKDPADPAYPGMLDELIGGPVIGGKVAFSSNPQQVRALLNALLSKYLFQDSIINALVGVLYPMVLGAFEDLWGDAVAGAIAPMPVSAQGMSTTARPRMYPLYRVLAADEYYGAGSFARDMRLYPNMFGSLIDSRDFGDARALLTAGNGITNVAGQVNGRISTAATAADTSQALADSLQYPTVFRRSWNPSDMNAQDWPYAASSWMDGGGNAYGQISNALNTAPNNTAVTPHPYSNYLRRIYRDASGNTRPNPWSPDPTRGTPQLYRLDPTKSNETMVPNPLYDPSDPLSTEPATVRNVSLDPEKQHPLNIPWGINGDAELFAKALRTVFHGIWPIAAALLTDWTKQKLTRIGTANIDNVALVVSVSTQGIELVLDFGGMPSFAALLNPVFEALLGLDSESYTLTPQQLQDIGKKNPGSRAVGGKQNYANDAGLYLANITGTHGYTNMAARLDSTDDGAAVGANRTDGPQDLVNAIFYTLDGLIGKIAEEPASNLLEIIPNAVHAIDADRLKPLLDILAVTIGVTVQALGITAAGCVTIGSMEIDVGLGVDPIMIVDELAGTPEAAAVINALGSAGALEGYLHTIPMVDDLLGNLSLARLGTYGTLTVSNDASFTNRYQSASGTISMHGVAPDIPYDSNRHYITANKPQVLNDILHWAVGSDLVSGMLPFAMNSNSDWEVVAALAELVKPQDYSFTKPSGPLELAPPASVPFVFPDWWGQTGQNYQNGYDPGVPYGTNGTQEAQVDAEYLMANLDVILNAVLDTVFGTRPAAGWPNLLAQILTGATVTPGPADPAPLDLTKAVSPFTKEMFVWLVELVQEKLGAMLDTPPDPTPENLSPDPLRVTLDKFSEIIKRAIVMQDQPNGPTNTNSPLDLMSAVNALSRPAALGGFDPSSYTITNSTQFASALADFIRPLGDILGFLLTGKSLGILQIRPGKGETLLEVKGGEGWTEVKMLLDALMKSMGMPATSFMPELSALPVGYDLADELVKPIFRIVDELIKDPAKNLLSLLPTLAYYLLPQDLDDDDSWTAGDLDAPINQILQRLLHPLYVLVDTARPIIDIFGNGPLLDLPAMLAGMPFLKIVQNDGTPSFFDPGLNLDTFALFSFLDDKIENPVTGDPLPITPVMDLLRTFVAGEYEDDGGVYYIEPNLPQVLFTILNFVMDNFLADILPGYVNGDGVNWIYQPGGWEFFTRLIQYEKVPGYGPIDYDKAPPVVAPIVASANYGTIDGSLDWFKKSQAQYLTDNIDTVINFLWTNLVYDSGTALLPPAAGVTGLNALVQGALDWVSAKVPKKGVDDLELTVEETLQDTIYSAFGNSAYVQEMLTFVVNLVLGNSYGSFIADGTMDFADDGLLGIIGDGTTPGELDKMINDLIDDNVAPLLAGMGLELNKISVANVVKKLIAVGDTPLDIATIFAPFKEYALEEAQELLTPGSGFTAAGFLVDSKQSAIDVAAKLFQPIFPILDFLLTGENLKIIYSTAGNQITHNANQDDDINNAWDPVTDPTLDATRGLITAYGYDGYEFGLMPLLLGIGADLTVNGVSFQTKVMTPAEFKLAASSDGQLKAILEPIFALLDAFLQNPVQTALKVVPNVVYMLTNSESGGDPDTSIMQQALNRLLQPVWELLDLLEHSHLNALLGTFLDPMLDSILVETFDLPTGSGLKAFRNLNLGNFVQDKIRTLLSDPSFDMVQLLRGTQKGFENPAHRSAGKNNHDPAIPAGGDYLEVDVADLLVALLFQFNIIGGPGARAFDFQKLIALLGDGGLNFGGEVEKIDYSLTDNMVDYDLPQWFMDTNAPQYLTKNIDTVLDFLWKEVVFGDPAVKDVVENIINGLLPDPGDNDILDEILDGTPIEVKATLKETVWQIFDNGIYSTNAFVWLIEMIKDKLRPLLNGLIPGLTMDDLKKFPVKLPDTDPILEGDVNLIEVLSRLITIGGQPIDLGAILEMFLNTDPFELSEYVPTTSDLYDNTIDSEAEFYEALGVVVGPIMPILSIFLAGSGVEVIRVNSPQTITQGELGVPNVFFNITGLKGYATLLPILMGIGAAVPGYLGALQSPADFQEPPGLDPLTQAKDIAAYQIRAIFEPIMTLLGSLLEKPSQTLLQVLPNLIYLVSQKDGGKSIAQQVVDQLFLTVESALDVVNGLGLLDELDLGTLLGGFDLTNLYATISEMFESDDPASPFNDSNSFLYKFDISSFLYGTKTRYAPGNGTGLEEVGKYADAEPDYADYIGVDLAEYLTFLLDKLIPAGLLSPTAPKGVAGLKSYEYLLGILGDGGLSAEAAYKKILYDPDQIKAQAATTTNANWLRSTQAAEYLTANMDTVINFLWKEIVYGDTVVADNVRTLVNGFVDDFGLDFAVKETIEETVWNMLGTQAYTTDTLWDIIEGLQGQLEAFNVPVFADFNALKDFIADGGKLDLDDLDVALLQGAGTINLFDLIGRFIFINGDPVDIGGILNHFLNLVYDPAQWDIVIDSPAAFFSELARLIGPVMPILSILLAGGTLEFINIDDDTTPGTEIFPMGGITQSVFLSIKGPDAYGTVLLPLLMGLVGGFGLDGEATLMLPGNFLDPNVAVELALYTVGDPTYDADLTEAEQAFMDENSGIPPVGQDLIDIISALKAAKERALKYEAQVKAIFEPVMFVINRLLQQPVDTLLTLLPNLLYLITDAGDDTAADESILQQAINNLLAPLGGILDFVNGLLDSDKQIDLSDIKLSDAMSLNINSLHLDKKINDLLGSTGIDLKKLILGTPGVFTETGFGEAVGVDDNAYFVAASTPEILIAALDMLLPGGIASIEKFEYLLKILGDGGIDFCKDAADLIDYDETLIHSDAPTDPPLNADHAWLHATNAAEYLTGNMDTVINFLWKEIVDSSTTGVGGAVKDLLDGLLPEMLTGYDEMVAGSGVQIKPTLQDTVWGIVGTQAFTSTTLWTMISGLQSTLRALDIPIIGDFGTLVDNGGKFDLAGLNAQLASMGITLSGEVKLFDLIGKVIFINDEPVVVDGILSHFLGLQQSDFNFVIDGPDAFYAALESLVGPVMPILTILLAGGSLEIINIDDGILQVYPEFEEEFPMLGVRPKAFLSIKGPDAYGTVLLPLLMALVGGFGGEDMLMLPGDFIHPNVAAELAAELTDRLDEAEIKKGSALTPAEEAAVEAALKAELEAAAQIKAIFEPIMFVLDRLLTQPVDTLLTLLPNILFLLVDNGVEQSILQQAINNMLLPLNDMLGTVNGFLAEDKQIDIHKLPLTIAEQAVEIDLTNLKPFLDILFGALTDKGIDLSKLVIGSPEEFKTALGDNVVSKNGGSWYAGQDIIGGETQAANMLIMLLDMLLPIVGLDGGIDDLEGFKDLLKILGDGGIDVSNPTGRIFYDEDLIFECTDITSALGLDHVWLHTTNAAEYLTANMDTVIDFLWREIIATGDVKAAVESSLNGILPAGLGPVALQPTLRDTVWDLIGTQTFSTTTLEGLIGMVGDFLDGFLVDLGGLEKFDLSKLPIDFDLPETEINLLEIIGKVVTINGQKIDVAQILTDFKALAGTPAKFTLNNTPDSFYAALNEIIGPLMPVLTILLAGSDLEIINLDDGDGTIASDEEFPEPGMKSNVFLNIKGPDAYGTVLLPLLMGLVGGFGAEGEATLKTPGEFAEPPTLTDPKEISLYQIKAIFEPIMFVIDKLLTDPVDTLLTLLPNLLYLIAGDAPMTDVPIPGVALGDDVSILQQALTNMLKPLDAILTFLDDMGFMPIDIENIALGSGSLNLRDMHLDQFLNELLEGILKLNPGDIDVSKLVIGGPLMFATKFGTPIALDGNARKIGPQTADLLIMLLDMLIPEGLLDPGTPPSPAGIEGLRDFEDLLKILGAGGVDLKGTPNQIEYNPDLIKGTALYAGASDWLRDTDAALYLAANMDTVIDFLWREIIAAPDIGIKQALEGFLNNMLPEGLKKVELKPTLSQTVWDLVGTQTYTTTTLWAIIEGLRDMLKKFDIPFVGSIENLAAFDLSDLDLGNIELTGTINLFALIGKLIFVNDAPIQIDGALDAFFALKASDLVVTDKASFFAALNKIIGPLMPILNILLAGGSLEIINIDDGIEQALLADEEAFPLPGKNPKAFLSITGPDAYGTVLLPLLMGLVGGIGGEATLKTPSEFAKPPGLINAADISGYQIEAIFGPIMYAVEQLLLSPVDTLLKLVPNLLYLIVDDDATHTLHDKSILQQAIDNLLAPLDVILTFLDDMGFMPIDIEDLLDDGGTIDLTNLHLDAYLNMTLNELLDPGHATADFDVIDLIIGEALPFDAGINSIGKTIFGYLFPEDPYANAVQLTFNHEAELLMALIDILVPADLLETPSPAGIDGLQNFEYLLKILGKGGVDLKGTPNKIKYDPALIKDTVPSAGTLDWLRETDAALYLASNADTVIDFLWKEIIAAGDVKVAVEDLLAGFMPGGLPPLELKGTLKDTVWQVFGESAYTTDNIEFLVEMIKDLLRGFDIPIGGGNTIGIEDLKAFDLNELDLGAIELNGKVNLLKIIGKVVRINGQAFDVSAILDKFMGLTPADYTILDGANAEESFYGALNNIIGPLMPVLNILLAGGSLEIINIDDGEEQVSPAEEEAFPKPGINQKAFLSITGPDAYGTVLLPLLMGLVGGLGGESLLKTQAQFAAPAGTEAEDRSLYQIKAIFEPIMFVIDKLLTAPVDTLLKLVPNLLYLIAGDATGVDDPIPGVVAGNDVSILQQAINNLLRPIKDEMLPFVNSMLPAANQIDINDLLGDGTINLTDLHLDAYLNTKLNSALTPATPIYVIDLIIGLATKFATDVKDIATDEDAYYADLTNVEKAELLMALIDILVPADLLETPSPAGIDGLQNFEYLLKILGKGGVDFAGERKLIDYNPALIKGQAQIDDSGVPGVDETWIRGTKAADYLAMNADAVIDFLWKNVIADADSGMKAAVEGFINGILPASLSSLGPVVLANTLSQTVWDTIGTQAYTTTTLFALVENLQNFLKTTFTIPIGGGITVEDLKAFDLGELDAIMDGSKVNLLALIGKVVSINGEEVDVGAILDAFFALKANDFSVTNEATFYTALNKIIGPLMPVLSILLAGGNLEIINLNKDGGAAKFPMDGGDSGMEGQKGVFLNIRGPEAYGTVLLPLLMALVGGLDGGEGKLRSPEQFAHPPGLDDAAEISMYQIKAIFEPIMHVVNCLLLNPVDTLLKLIPNLLYLITDGDDTHPVPDGSILQQAIDNMLRPIKDEMLPFVNSMLPAANQIDINDLLGDGTIDLTNLHLDAYLNTMLNDALDPLDANPDFDLLDLLIGAALPFGDGINDIGKTIFGYSPIEDPYANAVQLLPAHKAELLIAAIDMFLPGGINKLEDFAALIDILGDGGLDLSENEDATIIYDPALIIASDTLPMPFGLPGATWLRTTNAPAYLAANADAVIDFLWKNIIADEDIGVKEAVEGFLNALLDPFLGTLTNPIELKGTLSDTVWQLLGNEAYTTDNLYALIQTAQNWLNAFTLPAAVGGGTIPGLSEFDLAALGITNLTGTINLFEIIDKVVTVNNDQIGVADILDTFMHLTWSDCRVYDKESFFATLTALVGPLMPILSILLAGGGLEIINTGDPLPLQGKDHDVSKPNVFLNIKGPNAYDTILLPLLMGLVGGLDDPSTAGVHEGLATLKTKGQFLHPEGDTAAERNQYQIEAIFGPIMFVVESLLSKPVDTLLRLVPNLLYLIMGDATTADMIRGISVPGVVVGDDISILQQAINNMLNSIEGILGLVSSFLSGPPLTLSTLIPGLDLANLHLDAKLQTLLGGAGMPAFLATLDLKKLIIGEAVLFEDGFETVGYGDEAYYVEANKAELLIRLLEELLPGGIDTLDPYDVLLGFLGEGGVNLDAINKKIDYSKAGAVVPQAPNAGTDGWLRDTNAAQYLAGNIDTVVEFLWKEVVVFDNTAPAGEENGVLNVVQTLINNFLPSMFLPFELKDTLKDTVYQLFENQSLSTHNIELLINMIKGFLTDPSLLVPIGGTSVEDLNAFDLSGLGVTDLNGNVNLLAIIGKIATINGEEVDVEGIINNFLALTIADYTVTSPDDFYRVLDNVVGPLMPILSILLAGGDLEIINLDDGDGTIGPDEEFPDPGVKSNVFLNIKGPDAYGTVLLPLLMGLVGGLKDAEGNRGETCLLSPTAFAAADSEAQIRAIFEPIMLVIDGIVTRPVETLLKLVPNLLYLITDGNGAADDTNPDESILQQALNNMTASIERILGVMSGFIPAIADTDADGSYLDDLIPAIDLTNMHIDKILADLLGGAGMPAFLQTLDLKKLIIGDKTLFSAASGLCTVGTLDQAYFVDVDTGELLIALLDAVLDIDNDLKNFQVLLKILGDGGLDASGAGDKIDYTTSPNAQSVVYPDWFQKDKHAQYLVDNLDLTINWLWESLVYSDPKVNDVVTTLLDSLLGGLGISVALQPTLADTVWGIFDTADLSTVMVSLIDMIQGLLGGLNLTVFENFDVDFLTGGSGDTVNLLAVLAKVLKVGGDPLDVVKIIDDLMALLPADFQFGGQYYIASKDDIIPVLAQLVGPLMPVLSIFLVGGDLDIITLEDGTFPIPGINPSTFLSIKGGEAYGTAILPLLVGIGGGVPGFLTDSGLKGPDEFKTLTGEEQVAAIFEPIFWLLDRLLENPVTTLMQILPNVMYIISSEGGADSILQQALNNILAPVTSILDLLVDAGLISAMPAILDDLISGSLDVEGVINDLLGSLKPGLTTKDFIVGTRTPLQYPLNEMGIRGIAFYIKPDAADMITQLLDKFGVFGLLEENDITYLVGLLGNQKVDSKFGPLDYGFTPEPMKVAYYDWFQKNRDAQYLVDNVDAVVNWLYSALFANNMIGKTNITKIAGVNLEDTLEATFAGIFPADGNIYIQYFYDMILDLVKGLISGLDGIDLTNFEVGELLGIGSKTVNLLEIIGKMVRIGDDPLDVETILQPFMDYTPGADAYKIKDEASFKAQLVKVLSPLMPIVNVFLAGTDIKIIDNTDNTTGMPLINDGNGFISIFGHDGYEKGLLPILMALGADFGAPYLAKLLPAGKYATATAEQQVLAIVEPILFLLEQLAKNPITTIMRVLPNLIYFITDETTPAGSPSLLQQCIDRLLFPIASMSIVGDLTKQSKAKLDDLQKKFDAEEKLLEPEREKLAKMKSDYDATLTAEQRALKSEIDSLKNEINGLNKKIETSDRIKLLRNVKADAAAYDAEVQSVKDQKAAAEAKLNVAEPKLAAGYTAAQKAMQTAISAQEAKCKNKYEDDLKSENTMYTILSIASGKELRLGDMLNGLLEDLLPGLGFNAFKIESLITGKKTAFPTGYKEVGVRGVTNFADFIKVDMADLLTQLLQELGVFLLLEENNLTSLILLLNPDEVAVKGAMPGPVAYGAIDMVSQANLYPTFLWRRAHAGFLADNAEDVLNKLMIMILGKPLGFMKSNGQIAANTILSDLLGEKVFTQDNFKKILDLVQGFIPDISGILENDTITGAETLLNRTIKDLAFKVVTVNGKNIDLLHLLNHLKTWKPAASETVTDQASFLKLLLDYLEPVVPLLDFLLAGEDIRLIKDATIDNDKGFLKTFGYQGYRFGLIPILEALLMPLGAAGEITEPEVYVGLNDRDKLQAILHPILYLVETALSNPFKVVLKVVPNVAYFLSENTTAYKPVLQQSLDRVTYTLNYLGLGSLLGLDSNDPESLITLDVMSILNGLIGKTGLNINASILDRFIIGTLVDYTALSGGRAKYVDADSRLGRADLITALFRVLIEIWKVKENRDAIYELVLGLGIVKGFMFTVLRGAVEMFTRISLALGKWGIDLALNAFFRRFYWTTKIVNTVFYLFFRNKAAMVMQPAMEAANFTAGVQKAASQPITAATVNPLNKVLA